MRVKSITVKKLFGVFDHQIPLQSAERVTIIHGPNGFGKTVMLRMIQAIAEGDNSIFELIPFDEFRLTLDDGTSRVIRRGQEADAHDRKVPLEILVVDQQGHETVTPQQQLMSGIPRAVLDRIDRSVVRFHFRDPPDIKERDK
jgi:predicted ATP-binding protein involved in virulence